MSWKKSLRIKNPIKKAKDTLKIAKKPTLKKIFNEVPVVQGQRNFHEKVSKEGLKKQLTMGRITGSDRAKELERRKTAAMEAEGGVKIPEADQKPTELPTMDMAEVQEAKRRKLLEFMSRSGRRSTILSDKSY